MEARENVSADSGQLSPHTANEIKQILIISITYVGKSPSVIQVENLHLVPNKLHKSTVARSTDISLSRIYLPFYLIPFVNNLSR